MIHPYDQETLQSLLRVEQIPDDVSEEYEIRRRMYHSAGGSGMVGVHILIDMLRFLGYGKLEKAEADAVTDWRKEIGKPVIAKYKGKKTKGVLVGLAQFGRLDLELEGFGRVEIPRKSVRLAPKEELVAK